LAPAPAPAAADGIVDVCHQGWLGRSDHVLHQGEGPIRAVAWHGSILAWANDVGIKVRPQPDASGINLSEE